MSELPAIFRPADPSVEALHAAMRPSTPAPRRPADLSPEQWAARRQRELVANFFRRAFERPTITLDDLLPARCLCAWRITREMARIRGFVATDESLSEMENSRWTVPVEAGEWNCGKGWHPDYYDRRIRDRMIEFSRPSPGYMIVDPKTGHEVPGLALTPPPIPLAYIDHDTKEPFEGYDPLFDRLLSQWIEVISMVAKSVGVGAGCDAMGHLESHALDTLLDRYNTRNSWPSPLQIVSYELILVEETLDMLVNRSARGLQKELNQKYGLARYEIEQLTRMARGVARSSIEGDIEEDRALMALRLDDFVNRAKQSMDLRAELAGLKTLAVILGLSRVEPHDTMKDIIGIIAEGAEQRINARMESSKEREAMGLLPVANGSQGEIIN